MSFFWPPFSSGSGGGGGGGGDVNGPGASTDNAVVRWNGILGTSIQNSAAVLSDAGVLSTAGALLTGLTASTALVADGSKNVTSSVTTLAELAFVSGVTSAIQTQLNGKEPSITTLTIAKGGTNSGVALNNNRVMQSSTGAIVEAAAITAARALISDANGIPTHSAVTATTLAFLDATSSVQTQLDTKAIGVASAVDGEIALFSGTGGKQLKRATGSGVVTISSGVLSTGTVSLTADVTGVLPVANGGTNSSTALSNSRFIVSAAGALVENAAVTGNRALASTAGGLPVASATTDTELGFVSGVTSSIQTQINNRLCATQVISVAADVTLTNKAIHFVDTSAARLLTLPAPIVGLYIVIKDSTGTANANNITLVRPGAQKIETVTADFALNTDLGSWTICSDGTDYFII